ncbi:hypothetical protein AAG906_001809 [Vitis piasezkii]
MENFLRSKEYWGLVENGILKNIEDQKLKDLKAKNYLFQAIDRSAGESVNEYFARTLTIANKMKANGDDKGDVAVVEKILRSMTPKFDYVVCSIEESKNIDTLTIDELQSSLLVHEQRMSSHEEEEHALKITHGEQSGGRVECYYCHKLGHFQWECPSKEKEANYAQTQEEMLPMSYVDMNKANGEDMWFLDSGCNNHMCGKKEYFSDFDGSFRDSVKLGNNSSMVVMGKGNCKVFHPEKGLIMETKMALNRMFILHAISQPIASACFNTITEDMVQLWHCRYGHLSFKGLKTLQQKKMVNGLPQLKSPQGCKACLVGSNKGSHVQGKAPKAS